MERISDVKSIIKKLEFAKLLLFYQKRYLKIHWNPDNKYHVEIDSNLKDNFKIRLKMFNKIASVAQFVISPFMELDIQ